jgi:hypothetical protein
METIGGVGFCGLDCAAERTQQHTIAPAIASTRLTLRANLIRLSVMIMEPDFDTLEKREQWSRDLFGRLNADVGCILGFTGNFVAH